ncbi:hypothetical protein F4778DRAFT_801673 [Xylariomycetidae sp. FL2044]|nr:hypothetical protein F4778DRAFT_801673 [Xylariomycetidae sp. FL2044]
MPQFIFVELPSFRIKTMNGQVLNLNYRQLGLVEALYQFTRSGLQAMDYVDLSASILFANGETDLWFASTTLTNGHHAEENLLMAKKLTLRGAGPKYFQSFDSPGSYPIMDAMLLSNKPCSSCVEYFTLGGKTLRPREGASPPFRAKFTARSDRNYTPVFYLARGLDAAQRAALWLQLAHMRTTGATDDVVLFPARPGFARGQVYYLFHDSPWFALNDQENMTDAEVAESIAGQEVLPTYWIGR